MKDNQPYYYLAFLIRLWREDESTHWRATLENPHTDERHGFAALWELIAFLEKETGEKIHRVDRKPENLIKNGGENEPHT